MTLSLPRNLLVDKRIPATQMQWMIVALRHLYVSPKLDISHLSFSHNYNYSRLTLTPQNVTGQKLSPTSQLNLESPGSPISSVPSSIPKSIPTMMVHVTRALFTPIRFPFSTLHPPPFMPQATCVAQEACIVNTSGPVQTGEMKVPNMTVSLSSPIQSSQALGGWMLLASCVFFLSCFKIPYTHVQLFAGLIVLEMHQTTTRACGSSSQVSLLLDNPSLL